MYRLLAVAALSLTTLVGVSCSMPEQESASANSSLETELQDLVNSGQLPGAFAVIERDGEPLEQALVGWQNVENGVRLREDAIFRLYSMSKPITSVAIMMLAERGELALDDPASKFLPELADMRVYVSGGLDDMVTEPLDRPITIRDLLLHNSGIAYHFTGNTPVHQYYRKHGVMRDTPVGRTPEDGPPARSLDELVQRIGGAPSLHQPGEGFHYSYSTTVLGAVIERVTGNDLDTALRTLLFEPLGMSDTSFFVSDDQLPRFTTLYSAVPGGIEPTELPEMSDYRDRARLLDGGGALASTAADYLRFARMLANEGELDGRRYLSAESVRAMFTPHIQIEGLGPESTGFGYGFAIGDMASQSSGGQPAGTAGWSGSGNTYFFVNPDTGLVALLMTHELTPGSEASRTAQFREIINRAAVRAQSQ